MQTRAAQAVRLFASSLRRALTVYPPVTFPPLAISAISFWMRGIDLDTEEDLQLVRSTELLPFLESLVVPPVPKRTTKLSPTEMTLLYLQSEMSHLAGLGITAIALRCASLNYLPKAGRKVVRRLPTIMLEVARAPIASALAHQILDALVVLLASMAGKEAVKEFRNSEALQALFMLLESSLGEHDATLQDLVFQILKQVRQSIRNYKSRFTNNRANTGIFWSRCFWPASLQQSSKGRPPYFQRYWRWECAHTTIRAFPSPATGHSHASRILALIHAVQSPTLCAHVTRLCQLYQLCFRMISARSQPEWHRTDCPYHRGHMSVNSL
jgi:hypothetical protein